MLPGGPNARKSSSSYARCGRLIRYFFELLSFYNAWMPRAVLKRQRKPVGRKLECFKSSFAWILVFCLYYIVFVGKSGEVKVIVDDGVRLERLEKHHGVKSFVSHDIYHEHAVEEELRQKKYEPEIRDKEPIKAVRVENVEKKGPISTSEMPLPDPDSEIDQLTTLEENIARLTEKAEEIDKELNHYVGIRNGYVRAKAVQDAFDHAFGGYTKHAWGHDEIRPETNETNDSWGGFGVVIIDSLSTMCILGFDDYLAKSEEHVRNLNFEKDVVVSFFETTIRHIGGLLSGYECSGREIFLEKAVELADRMIIAFDSPSGYPYHQVNLKTGERKNAGWTNNKSILSEVASIQLEWYALTLYSGITKYHEVSKKALDRVLENTISEYPGLYYNFLDINTGNFSEDSRNVISVGGAGDSFYEYLLKISLMLPASHAEEKRFLLQKYEESVRGVHKHLVKGRENERTFVGTIGDGDYEMEHLACFLPGTLTLGYLESDAPTEDFELASELLETCIYMYEASETGLAADRVRFDENSGEFQVQVAKFLLRPETVESLFYMYRATKDVRYQDVAWEIFKAIEEWCRTDSAYTGLADVRSGRTNNSMQSFFISEVLKYFYLLFHPESEQMVDFKRHIFSTEGQVFRRF